MNEASKSIATVVRSHKHSSAESSGELRVDPSATAGMPQDGEHEIEMVGVQAGHETAHIFERLANCEGFGDCQNVPFS